MAGFAFFLPLRMGLRQQIDKVFFGLDVGNTDKVVNIPVANLAAVLHIFFFLCSVRLLPDAIGSPAAAKLGAGTLGGAKTVKITLCALYFLDQVFLGVFPSIV